MTTPESPFDVEDVRARVSLTLSEYVVSQLPSLKAISSDVVVLHELLTAFTSGGKRLRPVLAWWGWRAAGGTDDQAMIRAAASLELLQACALIHDDVMDGSDTRRGAPSIHRSLEALHAKSGWRGSAEEFGVAGAILLGDLCLSWSDQLLFESGLSAEALIRTKSIFDITRTELMAGQYLDVVEQARADIDADRALLVARYKSAKYTVERPLHIGATLAGAPEELIAALSDFGLPLGEAFQLRDDVLGVFGDPQTTGKPAGDDLREGKQTYLIACAFERANSAQTEALTAGLGDPYLTQEDVNRLRDLIIDTGALAQTEERIEVGTDSALNALAATQLENGASEVLSALAIAATRRTT